MEKAEKNPFMEAYTTKYEIPPFSKIKYEHYIPAMKAGIEERKQEIWAIVSNRAMPDFDNTILALDNSGALLNKVCFVYYALSESDNTPEMEKISEEAMPMLTAAADEMMLNQALFERIKQVYDRRASLNLTTAQSRLLDKYYKSFVRNGALLSPADKETLKTINQQLANYELSYNSNILKETNESEIVVENSAELAGIPESAIGTAAEEATRRGKSGKWVFTVHAPSRLAVLTYADNRDLRRRMYETYTSLASNDNQYNNSANINNLIRLRTKKANLLGFETFADYQMDAVMAKTVKNAENLLYQIWTPAIAKVKEEVADMQAYVNNHGGDFKIAPYDYYYYAEKVKKEKFDLSEDDVRPYFQLENVLKGIFLMANRLYGITFTEMPKAPKYNPEVTVYDVKGADGKHIAVFMTDYFPRSTKRQGAWMSEMKGEYNYNGVSERPIIYNVGNFTKPSKNMPSLLTLDEVETAFHEFGHALQGMLTTAQFRGQAGTNVDRDFVELPSQIDEHWAMEPELLKEYAKHYKTGEVIPDELIKKLDASSKFNQGFTTTELVGAALLDIEWHKVNYASDIDVKAFERSVARRLGKPEEVEFRYRSPYFKHIFGSTQYACGYYTYLWAEVLDADGFELFKEKGIFDPATAKAYRENILEPGDSEDPMVLYKRFRGQEPTVDALLKNRGLK
ncbi:MAG: M3 family metallopeptidase [Muribaculaceae bacterium]